MEVIVFGIVVFMLVMLMNRVTEATGSKTLGTLAGCLFFGLPILCIGVSVVAILVPFIIATLPVLMFVGSIIYIVALLMGKGRSKAL